jgi:hypothetical protein
MTNKEGKIAEGPARPWIAAAGGMDG